MSEIATLSLVLDTTALKSGAAESQRALGTVEQAATSVGRTVAASAQAWVTWGTAAKAAAGETARAFQGAQAPAVTFRRQVEETGRAMQGMAPPAVTFRKALGDVQQAGKQTGDTMQSLVYSFNGLAASALGVSQSFGTLAANVLPSLGMGSGAVAGVLIAATAIGHAWRLIGGDAADAAKKAKEAAADMKKSLDDLVNSGSFEVLERKYRDALLGSRASGGQDGLNALRQLRASLAGQITRLGAGTDRGTFGGEDLTGLGSGQIAHLQQQIKDLDAQIAAKQTEVNALYSALTDPTNGQAFTSNRLPIVTHEVNDAKTAHDALQESLRKSREEAQENKRVFDQYTKALKEHADAMKELRAATAPLDAIIDRDLAAQINARQIAAMDPHNPTVLRGLIAQGGTETAIGATAFGFSDEFAAIKKTAREITAAKEFHEVLVDTVAQSVTSGVLRGLHDGVLGGRAFWETFAQLGESVLGTMLQRAMSGALSGKGGAVGAYGGLAAGAGTLGYGIGYASGSSAVGALGGAATGAVAGAAFGTAVVPVVGTAIGAVVGGAIGAIGGLIGAHNKAKQAAEAMAKAQEEYVKTVEYIRLSSTGNLTNELNDRELRAQGRDAEADAIQRRAAEDAEYYHYLDAGVSPELLERLRTIQRLEDERAASLAAQAQALREQEAAAERARMGKLNQSTTEDQYYRALVAQGKTDDAAAYRRSVDEQRAIDALIEQGVDASVIANERYVQSLEDQAAAAQKAAAATKLAAQAAEDQHYRELVAQGHADEAAAYRRTLEERDAIDRLIAQGADAATVANERYVQSIEDQAAAAQKAAEATKAAAQALAQLAASHVSAYQQRNGFLGENSPLSFNGMAVLATKSNPLIAQWLDGVDLSDPNAVDAAITRGIASMDAGKIDQFTAEQTSTFTDAIGIGGSLHTSAQQIRDSQIANVLALANGLPSTQATDATGSLFQGFSEATATEANALLRTIAKASRETADNTAGVSLFGGGGNVTITVRAVPGTGPDFEQFAQKLDQYINRGSTRTRRATGSVDLTS